MCCTVTELSAVLNASDRTPDSNSLETDACMHTAAQSQRLLSLGGVCMHTAALSQTRVRVHGCTAHGGQETEHGS